jgi:ribose transport system permease protein
MISRLRSSASSYGMPGALLLLCVYFSWATYHLEAPTGREGAMQLAAKLARSAQHSDRFVVVAQQDDADEGFADALSKALSNKGLHVVTTLTGNPMTVRGALEAANSAVQPGTLTIATNQTCSQWELWSVLRERNPVYKSLRVAAPEPEGRSAFLSASNLRNVADQIAVIAIIAVGMTMVIVSAGIDLSVGSLVALSAVITAWLIHRWGGAAASPGAMLTAGLTAIVACGGVGAFSGLMITRFKIPPFIATLAMMQVASGFAFIIAQGQSIYDIPPGFTWLGRGAALFTLPNAVVLMLLVYAGAHLFMARSTMGRRIYAVGGNEEASRLSGVSTKRTLIFVYLVSGLMAGIGGVVITSQLKAGAPTYGNMYELYVIAAVVVGGTSLSGGEGRIFGTLVGAFIIAVIRNGMNLVGVESYTQKVVLGVVILLAVMMDMVKRRVKR